jgi:GT2 family glycosyltransferase
MMTPPPDILLRVDNGSANLGIDPVRDAAPKGTLFIDLPTNIGWPAAVNRGMEVAISNGADWTLVLNNDATVAPTCLSRCLQEAGLHNKVAAIGPAIAFSGHPETLWFAGGQVSDWFAFTRHRGLMRPSASPPPSSETGFVTGCCFVVSSAAWRAIGPFRADYFAYYEDAEWAQRARAAGWHCRYVGEVLCSHAVGLTWNQPGSLGLSPNSAYYLGRNPLRFALESAPFYRRVSRVLGIMTVWNGYNALRTLQSKRVSVGLSYLEGLRDAIRGRMGQRRTIS